MITVVVTIDRHDRLSRSFASSQVAEGFTWYMVHGTWYMVHGTWYMVPLNHALAMAECFCYAGFWCYREPADE